MTEFTVTFIFNNAVVTTSVRGSVAIIARAQQQLRQELNINAKTAEEFHIYEHPTKESHELNA